MGVAKVTPTRHSMQISIDQNTVIISSDSLKEAVTLNAYYWQMQGVSTESTPKKKRKTRVFTEKTCPECGETVLRLKTHIKQHHPETLENDSE